MKYRLYYWYKGAPANRIGGPWWYMDFGSEDDREKFLESGRPVFRAYVKVEGEALPGHDPMRIAPPKTAEVTLVQ